MTYNSGPAGRHKKRMMTPLTLFENEYALPNQLPPDNSSKLTLKEVKYLANIEEDIEFVKKHDKIRKVFKETLNELELPYIKEELESLLDQSAKFVMELKYKYNRPRPWQIAEFYGVKLEDVDMESMRTPSYPSGHAVQGRLAARFLSDIYPDHAENLMKLGDDIATSRLIAKVHFISDSTFGTEIGDSLFNFLGENI